MADEPTSLKTLRAEEADLLARLQGPYLVNVSQKIDEIASLLCRCVGRLHSNAAAEATSDPCSVEDLREAHRLAHSLVGSGASYGLPGISTQARVLEKEMETLLVAPPTDQQPLLEILTAALTLRSDIQRARDGDRTALE